MTKLVNWPPPAAPLMMSLTYVVFSMEQGAPMGSVAALYECREHLLEDKRRLPKEGVPADILQTNGPVVLPIDVRAGRWWFALLVACEFAHGANVCQLTAATAIIRAEGPSWAQRWHVGMGCTLFTPISATVHAIAIRPLFPGANSRITYPETGCIGWRTRRSGTEGRLDAFGDELVGRRVELHVLG